MDAPPPQRGRGSGGPPRGRGGPRRGHAGAPSIPKNLPTYAPQRSSAVSENGAPHVASASPRGRGGRGGRGAYRGRGRGGRGRGISTQSQAPAPPSPSPAAVPGLASPESSPAPATPPAVPNLAPRASPSPAKYEEVQRLRDAKVNNTPGYEMAIVETVENMLTHTKGRPNQQTRAYIHNAMRTQYAQLIPTANLSSWVDILFQYGDCGGALEVIDSGKLIERLKYNPGKIVKAAIEAEKSRADAVNFISRHPSHHGLTINDILAPLSKSGDWALLMRVAGVLNLPAFGEALLRKLVEVNAGLARAWAGDLVATIPADLARLTLNPLTLATLSPGATTYWIDTVEAVDALAAVLMQQREVGGQSLRKRGLPFSLVLGMDVESRPSFNGQRNRPSIIQISSFITIAMIDLNAPRVLAHFCRAFTPLLSASDVVVCGAGIWNDFAELERPPHNAVLPPMSAVLDLSEAFLALWPGFVQRPGLKRLVAYALGLRLNKSKSMQTSNWDARPLSAHQISYAAEDVNVLPHVATVLLEQLPANSPLLRAAVARPKKGSRDHTVLASVPRITP